MSSIPRSRHLALVMATAAVLLGSACSKATKVDTPEVATLASAGSTPAASASAAAADRPRERLDTTPEEFEAMLKPYYQCINDQGAKNKHEWGNRKPTMGEVKKLEKADRYCNPRFFPLPPWEKDPANPEAKDFARDVVKCLKDKGIKYVAVGGNGVDVELGGEQNDMDSIRRGLDLMPECERDTAAKK
jgi:hypothetical protein